MSFRKILLSCASLSLLASCDPRVFDDLSDSTWVDSSGKPGDLSSAGYGSGLIGSSDGTGDLRYFVAAENPPAVVLVSFNKAGSKSSQTVDLPGNSQFPVPTIMASDPSGFAAANADSSANGNAVVAVIGELDSSPALAMLRPDTSAPVVNIPLTGMVSATGIAFGASDATAETDLLAAGGTDLNLIGDYKAYASEAVPNCSLGGQAGGLILADVDVAAGSEYLVGVGNSVSVGQASLIAPNSGCSFLDTIAAPGGEASFGRTLQSGDFDGNGAADLAIAAPDENAVYVFLNWTVAMPTTGTKIANPEGAAAFGANIAVGDFDGDGSDELVISDHARDADGVSAAGTVYIYSESGGQFTAPIELHDAQPESDQLFGKSLTVAKAFGGDSLVVGAKNEVFTYFRTPVDGDGDSRE